MAKTLIKQLGYLGFGVSSLSDWENFSENVLGLEIAKRVPNGFSLRMDSYAQRFLVLETGADDLEFVGWEVEDAAAMEALRDRLESAGVAVEDGSTDEVALRDVQALIRFRDPSGIPVEIFYGPKMGEGEFESKLVHGGFNADTLGLGHLVISTPNRDESRDFYIEVLGFGLSDHIICDLGGYQVNVAFLHVNSRHHSLAMGGPMDKRVHHFLLEVRSIDDVGAMLDRVERARLQVVQGLGRHPNDRMLSFYAHTPSGFQFECGFGGREIDPSDWEPTVYDQISEWGHRFQPRRKPRPEGSGEGGNG